MHSIKQQALKHYDEMIQWAGTQPAEAWVNACDMNNAIDAYWYGTHCPYCNRHAVLNCTDCPLKRNSGCCGDLWVILDDARTWGEWLVAAKAVRKFISQVKEDDSVEAV